MLVRSTARALRLRQRAGVALHKLAPFSSLPDGVEELAMPALSPTMTVGTITTWLKKEGDALQPGEVLCQIETDKAVVDYEIQDDGVLARILLPTGAADVPVGALLAYTVPDQETYDALAASGALSQLQASSSSSGSAAVEAPTTQAAAPPSTHGHRQPLIKFLGKRSLLPASAHAATTAAAAAPTPAVSAPTPTAPAPTPSAAVVPPPASTGGAFTDIALSNMRKVIAKRLAASKVTVPHHYASIDCEIDNIMALRQQLKKHHDVKVSLNDFLLKAIAATLRDVPEANCFFNTATNDVEPHPSVDIAVAVATATGLITPIVPRVDALGLSGVNSKFTELVGRARQNKLKPEEFQGGSFTVSNLGGFGIDSFTAVINQPAACIMAVGRGRKELLPPIGDHDDTATPRLATLLNVTLSADRRVVDNVIAGQFLQVFKRYMEYPELLAL